MCLVIVPSPLPGSVAAGFVPEAARRRHVEQAPPALVASA
jgi:hypothetical protein